MNGSPLQTTLLPAMAGTANLSTVSPAHLQLTVFQILHLVQQNHKLLQLIQDSALHEDTSILLYLEKVKNTCQQLELKTDCKIISYETAKIKNSLSQMEQIINETQVHKQIIRDLETRGENCTKWSQSLQDEVNDKVIQNQLLKDQLGKNKDEILFLKEKLQNETVSNKLSQSRIIDLEAKLKDSIKSTQECLNKSADEDLLFRKQMENCTKWSQSLQSEVNNKLIQNQLLEDRLEKNTDEILFLKEKLQNETLSNKLSQSQIIELDAKLNDSIKSTQECLNKSAVEVISIREQMERNKEEYELKLQQKGTEIEQLQDIAKQAKEINKRYALNKAVKEYNTEAVRILLEAGLSTETVDSVGYRPLHNASYWGYLEIVKLLVKHGANLTARTQDQFKSSCLHHAAYNNHLEVVKYLLSVGVPVDITNKYGQTPLGGAAWHGNYDTAQFLITSGADVNIHNINGDLRTPLHSAAYKRHPHIVELLLKNGANIESLDKDGETPLHWAAWTGSLEAVKVLVKHGANLHAKSNFGKTPKDIAATKGFSEIVQFLEL